MRPDIGSPKEVGVAAINEEIKKVRAQLEQLAQGIVGSVDVRASMADLRQIAREQGHIGGSQSQEVNRTATELKALAEKDRQEKIFQLQVKLEALEKEAQKLGVDAGEPEQSPMRKVA